MPRSIGRINILTLKRMVDKELSNPYVGSHEVCEKVMNNIPDEWYDIWEGAYMEIQRIIMDKVMEFQYQK